VAYNFQTRRKIKLLTEYEGVMRRLQRRRIKLSELKFHISGQFYFVISDLNIIDHGNPDSNLESSCTIMLEDGA
jgi:hypothetical protein